MERDHKTLKELKLWLKEFDQEAVDKYNSSTLDSDKHHYHVVHSTIEDVQNKIDSLEEQFGKASRIQMLKEVELAAAVARRAQKPTVKLRFYMNNHWGTMHVQVDRAVQQANRWLTEDGVEIVKAI